MRLIAALLLVIATVADATTDPLPCGTSPIPAGTDAELVVTFATGWTPTSATVRVDGIGTSPPTVLLPPTVLTPTDGAIDAIIPATANYVTQGTRQDALESHLVTLQWFGGCRGGANLGIPCAADADCPGSTCQTGGVDCVLKIRGRTFVGTGAPAPSATPTP